MAHDIFGDSMAYAGEMPWHKIGTKLDGNCDWSVMKDAAKFYDVEEQTVLAGNMKPFPGMKALVRKDTGQPLSVVSERYAVIQFDAIAETIVKASQGVGAIWHTAGLLGPTGVRAFMLAELPKVLRVKGDESEIKPYLLASAAHDGKHGVNLKNVCTRVVCANTLGVAMGESSEFDAVIHHTMNAEKRLAEAAMAFTNLIAGMDKFEAMANMMAEQKFTDAQMLNVVNTLLPLPEEKAPTTQLVNKREKVLTLFEAGTGIAGPIRGTAWAAFNAATEYADHHMSTRGDDKGGRRLESIWLGTAAAFKTHAMTAIQAEVTAAA